ncbi:MAG: dienelactone hydrolase family protein [Pseudomonadota bacterium]
MSSSAAWIKTRDGQSEATVFKPDTGNGPWPAVLVYIDGRGIRPALFELGERIAQAGYLVLLPDLFYRGGKYEAPDAKRFSEDEAFRSNWRSKYMATATKANIQSDTESFLSFLAARPDVRSLAIGTTGYCMGGGLSLAAAGNFADRVIAAASFHGGNLATEAEDSPHRLAPRIKARVYVAGAIEDPSFPDEQQQLLSEALRAAKVNHTVETYAGAKHGWVVSDSAVYNREASERHYRALIALFDATLKNAPPKG